MDMSKFWQTIYNSVKDHFGKESLARISSYFILVVIMINSLVYVSIDLINAIGEWRKPYTPGSSVGTYTIPMNHILLYSLLLAHHLVLLGLKKASDKMILGKDSLGFGVDNLGGQGSSSDNSDQSVQQVVNVASVAPTVVTTQVQVTDTTTTDVTIQATQSGS